VPAPAPLRQQITALADALTQRGDLGQQPQHQLHRRLPTGPRNPLGLLDLHRRRIQCAKQESSRSRRPT
jgi:hypothetical protein